MSYRRGNLSEIEEIIRNNNENLRSLISCYNSNQIIIHNYMTLRREAEPQDAFMSYTFNAAPNNHVNNTTNTFTNTFTSPRTTMSPMVLDNLLSLLIPSSLSNNRERGPDISFNIVNINRADYDEESVDIIEYDNFKDIDHPLNDECPITKERFYENYKVHMIKNCKHIFNPSALKRWTDLNNNTCPYCRAQIKTMNESGESSS